MTHRSVWTSLGLLVVLVGCASVEVKAPKDPIKMDIAMRLDVYQHVVKDVDSIEDIVEGRASKQTAFLTGVTGFWVGTAHADEGLSADATEAAYRRRDRRAELTALEVQGALGEANTALVVVRAGGNAAAQALATAENADRMIIYRAIAAKNGSSAQEVQKVYAERIRGGLPQGAHYQDANGGWTTK